MARPKLPEGQALSAMVVAQVRPAEKARLAQRALQLDASQSATVRRALLEFLDEDAAPAPAAAAAPKEAAR